MYSLNSVKRCIFKYILRLLHQPTNNTTILYLYLTNKSNFTSEEQYYCIDFHINFYPNLAVLYLNNKRGTGMHSLLIIKTFNS